MIEAVFAGTPLCADRALTLGTLLKLPVITDIDPLSDEVLAVMPDRIEVWQKNTKPILVDFLAPQFLHRLHTMRGRDPLLRAVGLKPQIPSSVLDATAGFGGDACMLAYFGAQVILLEREPIMGLLLKDGVTRAQRAGELMTVASRMQVLITDAKEYLKQLAAEDYPDVIYLDPMFVHHKSALPNKNMQFLQQHSGHTHDADALLSVALRCARKRVVVKRALQAPTLDATVPSLCIKSKLLRFDVYLTGFTLHAADTKNYNDVEG